MRALAATGGPPNGRGTGQPTAAGPPQACLAARGLLPIHHYRSPPLEPCALIDDPGL